MKRKRCSVSALCLICLAIMGCHPRQIILTAIVTAVAGIIIALINNRKPNPSVDNDRIPLPLAGGGFVEEVDPNDLTISELKDYILNENPPLAEIECMIELEENGKCRVGALRLLRREKDYLVSADFLISLVL